MYPASWAKFRDQQWCPRQLLATMCETKREKHYSPQYVSTLHSLIFLPLVFILSPFNKASLFLHLLWSRHLSRCPFLTVNPTVWWSQGPRELKRKRRVSRTFIFLLYFLPFSPFLFTWAWQMSHTYIRAWLTLCLSARVRVLVCPCKCVWVSM